MHGGKGVAEEMLKLVAEKGIKAEVQVSERLETVPEMFRLLEKGGDKGEGGLCGGSDVDMTLAKFLIMVICPRVDLEQTTLLRYRSPCAESLSCKRLFPCSSSR